MTEKRVNTFSTFLKTIQQSSAPELEQQRSATPSGAVETVLMLLRQHPNGIDARELLDASGFSVVEFGQVIERLQKLGGVSVTMMSAGEVILPGPQADELLSLIR